MAVGMHRYKLYTRPDPDPLIISMDGLNVHDSEMGDDRHVQSTLTQGVARDNDNE